jgi:hypothetical protein
MSERMIKSGWFQFRAREIVFCLFLTMIALAFSVRESSALSPPWWLYYYDLYYSVGKTSGVTVQKPVEGPDTTKIDIVVKDQKKRVALATLLRQHPEGDEEGTITIRVVDENGNVQAPVEISGTTEEKMAELKNLVLDAFKKNSSFFKVETVPPGSLLQPPGVFIIFKAKMVQFYTDDISDFYGRSTYIVTSLFKKVLNAEISGIFIDPSTKEFKSP